MTCSRARGRATSRSDGVGWFPTKRGFRVALPVQYLSRPSHARGRRYTRNTPRNTWPTHTGATVSHQTAHPAHRAHRRALAYARAGATHPARSCTAATSTGLRARGGDRTPRAIPLSTGFPVAVHRLRRQRSPVRSRARARGRCHRSPLKTAFSGFSVSWRYGYAPPCNRNGVVGATPTGKRTPSTVIRLRNPRNRSRLAVRDGHPRTRRTPSAVAACFVWSHRTGRDTFLAWLICALCPSQAGGDRR